jgi:hypothetical protein
MKKYSILPPKLGPTCSPYQKKLKSNVMLNSLIKKKYKRIAYPRKTMMRLHPLDRIHFQLGLFRTVIIVFDDESKQE